MSWLGISIGAMVLSSSSVFPGLFVMKSWIDLNYQNAGGCFLVGFGASTMVFGILTGLILVLWWIWRGFAEEQ